MPLLKSLIDHAIEQALPSCSPNISQYIQEPSVAEALNRRSRGEGPHPVTLSSMGKAALKCYMFQFYDREDLCYSFYRKIQARLFTPDVFISLVDFQRVPPELESIDPSFHIPILAYGLDKLVGNV
ncbi:hypothetical protein FB45DRAFT_1059288 [Roridomyces roridus]|uniref:Uncharacterized protein n=1 Tax=Roridomyces roridus TaxID=1738132 RepID=A0AAD7BR79_9AGAR|nr:hypothetical protein FB45DRAFT_1059288 [Roridomyces roridus]